MEYYRNLREDRYTCVHDKINTAIKDLVYGDRSSTVEMKDLEALLAKQTLMEILVMDNILFPDEVTLNVNMMSTTCISIRSSARLKA